MIDLHTHLVPAVDDGARTLEEARAALERLAADGVRAVACTPHLRASDVRRRAVPDHGAAFAALDAAAPAGLALRRGWEVMLDDPGVALDDPRLAIAGTRVVLVELPRGDVPPGADRELARLRASGVIPLVAHPERYGGMTPALARRWREAGALLQADATTLCGAGTRGTRARALLAVGAYDVIASDNHGDVRSPRVAAEWLAARGATDVATLLTETNPARLLAGEPPLPVPAVRAPEGVAQLRAWLVARLRGARPDRRP